MNLFPFSIVKRPRTPVISMKRFQYKLEIVRGLTFRALKGTLTRNFWGFLSIKQLSHVTWVKAFSNSYGFEFTKIFDQVLFDSGVAYTAVPKEAVSILPLYRRQRCY
jgi:hypothetical protein